MIRQAIKEPEPLRPERLPNVCGSSGAVALVQQFLDHFRVPVPEPVPVAKVSAQSLVVLNDGRQKHLLAVAAKGVDDVGTRPLPGLDGKIETAKGIRASVDHVAEENHGALQTWNVLSGGDRAEEGREKLVAAMDIRNDEDLLTGLGGERNGMFGDRQVQGHAFWGFPDNAFTDPEFPESEPPHLHLRFEIGLARSPRMDEDLNSMSREQLLEEVRRLRAGIREHRDSTGHELCWHHPDLWGLLPERLDPAIAVPPWPKFMRGCIHYRQSLDAQRPDAPVHDEEFE